MEPRRLEMCECGRVGKARIRVSSAKGQIEKRDPTLGRPTRPHRRGAGAAASAGARKNPSGPRADRSDQSPAIGITRITPKRILIAPAAHAIKGRVLPRVEITGRPTSFV